jgi:methyltransferase
VNAALIILALVVLQRALELVGAQRNTARLLAKGAYEMGAAHYPFIVGFHAAWLLGLLWLARDAAVNWWMIGGFVILQGLRLWVLSTLGPRWTTRILIVPGEQLVAKGPYRFFRHPNYAVVAAEIFVLPLALGLYWYSVLGGLINLALLWFRIGVEERALARRN